MIRLAGCVSVRYQHQLGLFTGCNIVVLRRLSVDFFDQVILKALLFPNSNIQEHFVTITGRVHTAGPMRKRSLILMKIEYKSC